MKFMQKILIISLWFSIAMLTCAQAEQVNWTDPKLAPLVQFFEFKKLPKASWPNLTYVDAKDLPAPYDFLLQQPLMTLGITKYYQRTPQVRPPLYTVDNPDQKVYARAIMMIVDNDKQRNDPEEADKLADATVAELGLISMNFAQLPQEVIDGVTKSHIPFGALLVKHNIKTHNTNVRFFKLPCSNLLSSYLNCSTAKPLYGRTNTLLRDDNGQWVAQVVEILTGANLPTTTTTPNT